MSCHRFCFLDSVVFETPSGHPPIIRSNSIIFSQFSSNYNNLKMSTGDFRVADISLADFGRKEIEIAEHEVTNCCDE